MVPPGFTTIEMQRESNEQIVDVGFVCFSSWFRLVFTLFFPLLSNFSFAPVVIYSLPPGGLVNKHTGSKLLF